MADRAVGLRDLPLPRYGADSFVLPVVEFRLGIGEDIRLQEEVVQGATALCDGGVQL